MNQQMMGQQVMQQNLLNESMMNQNTLNQSLLSQNMQNQQLMMIVLGVAIFERANAYQSVAVLWLELEILIRPELVIALGKVPKGNCNHSFGDIFTMP